MQEMLGMSLEDYRLDMKVDLVFVIDATESMQPMIDMVKDSVLSFHEKLQEGMQNARRNLAALRIKVIWFRDYYYDGDYAYGESKFFELPEEKEELREFVSSISANGGGDDPESSLEALAQAMRSDFVQDGTRRRHIIVLFTDAAAHPFEDYDDLVAAAAKKDCKPSMYPENMPKNLSELYNVWKGNAMAQDALGSDGQATKLDPTGRRLILVTPWEYPWNDIWESWEYVLGIDFRQEEDRRQWADDVLAVTIA